MWGGGTCTSNPALTTHFIYNPAWLSAQQPQVKSDFTFILPTMLIQSSLVYYSL